MTGSTRSAIKTTTRLSASLQHLKFNQGINQDPDLGRSACTKLPSFAIIDEVINCLRPPLIRTELTPPEPSCSMGLACTEEPSCSSGNNLSKEPTTHEPLAFSGQTTPLVEANCVTNTALEVSDYSWNIQPQSRPWLSPSYDTVPKISAGIQPVHYPGKGNGLDVYKTEPYSKLQCHSQPGDVSAFRNFSDSQQYMGQIDQMDYTTDSYSYINAYESRPQASTSERQMQPIGKKQQKIPCDICGRMISRDILRHRRTHDRTSRFQCVFPKECCTHKTGFFNRRYDLKKHLLHIHFILDDPKVKKLKSLEQKLEKRGHCLCGEEMSAQEWLDHITEVDENQEPVCPDLAQRWKTLKRKRPSK